MKLLLCMTLISLAAAIDERTTETNCWEYRRVNGVDPAVILPICLPGGQYRRVQQNEKTGCYYCVNKVFQVRKCGAGALAQAKKLYGQATKRICGFALNAGNWPG